MTPRLASSAPAILVHLDTGSDVPLHRQIYDSLRNAIVTGRLAAGSRLPATRTLSREIGVSRQTVVSAVEQLRAEGYIESRERSGMFVSDTVPDRLLYAGRTAMPKPAKVAPTNDVAWTRPAPARPFRIGFPAVDAFPWPLWARLLARHVRRSGPVLADYHHPAGYVPLRTAIAAYVSAARAVVCGPDQVIVTGGAQQALDLIARVLGNRGTDVWIEDPGYPGARQAFEAAGATLIPVPIDAHGLSVEEGARHASQARLVYVTPSHQYPSGVTMSAARRLELLAWARRAGAWVVEDDYNSEFRYTSRPLASLQGLDGGERVIYVGTFSKTLFPSLRLGYIVCPPTLLDSFLAHRYAMDRHDPTLEQAALAEFLADGHFARHVRRMRLLYGERRTALLHALQREAAGLIEPGPADAGMHLVGRLPAGVTDTAAATQAARAGIETSALSSYWLTATSRRNQRGGLLLGFAAFKPPAIAAGVKRLVAAIQGRA